MLSTDSTIRRCRMMPCVLPLLICILFSLSAFAQPTNDNWQNAIPIDFGANNLELGVFLGTPVLTTGAGLQTNEYVHASSHTRTVWYKFTLPTRRVIKVSPLQTASLLNSDDLGFVVYDSTGTAIPEETEIAGLTPIFVINGYSESFCFPPGTFYLQLCARNTFEDFEDEDALIQPEITIRKTEGNTAGVVYDDIDSGFDLGTVTYSNNQNFNWGCLSIQTTSEYGVGLGDSTVFSQTAWFRFQTDEHIDYFSMLLDGSSNDGETYGYRIYPGNIDSTGIESIAPIYESTAIVDNERVDFSCFLEPDSSYTLQIIGGDSFIGNNTIRLYHLGWDEAQSPFPEEPINALNDFGTLTPQPAPGVSASLTDYYSCSSLLTNASNQCGTVNPVDSIVMANGIEYDLTTWFNFSLSDFANVNLRTMTNNLVGPCTSNNFNNGIYMRLFEQYTDNDCTNYADSAIYFEGTVNGNGLVILNCIPPGDYAVQLLGTSLIDTNPYHCDSELGRRVTLTLTLNSIPDVEYGITAANDVDRINGGNALENGVLYEADSAYFSCVQTVIPDTSICAGGVDRAIYRQLIIGDADGNGSLDSGMVTISNYQYGNNLLGQYIRSPFYAGDANQVAIDSNTFAYPAELGLEPYDGCDMWNAFWYSGSTPFNEKKYCVRPGAYTLASVGSESENNALSLPRFEFEKDTPSQYSDPDNPENMGDLIASGTLSLTSVVDYFGCSDNALDIGGLTPCGGRTKQVYREFFLSEPARVVVSETSTNPANNFRVYQGRISDVGPDGVTLAPFHSANCYSSNSSWSNYTQPDNCTTIPAGWYTVVSYGFGPNYDNNYEYHEDNTYAYYTSGHNSVGGTSQITVWADTTVAPGPFYYEPHLACVSPDTIKFINTGTALYPSSTSTYTLCTERFTMATDTPFVSVNGCTDAVRRAFYVFTTDDQYFARIQGINGLYKELYPLDITTSDSTLFLTTNPIATCDNLGNTVDVCRLDSGTYTLVVYGVPGQDCDFIFTPSIVVSPLDRSRFDFANHAYDFGVIPGDDTYIGGKVADAHPTEPTYLPSNDFFYCTTGASPEDVAAGCSSGLAYSNEIYPDSVDNAYYQEPGTQTNGQFRNLWYTFVLEGMGTATVWVRNHTGTGPYRYAIYRSDEDGEVDFSTLVSGGLVDSTTAMGLEFITDNTPTSWNCNRVYERAFSFVPSTCIEDSTKRRYYIVIESDGPFQSQVDVQIKWDRFNAVPEDPKYDFYSLANVIANGEDAPPYTPAPLEFDSLYSGGWGSLACATGDTSDAAFVCTNPEDQKSLWYKLEIDEPGFLYMGMERVGGTGSISRNLLREVTPNDSIINTSNTNGLYNLGQGSSGWPNNVVPNYGWRWFCLEPGTYYYHIQRCAAVDTSHVRAHAYFQPRYGDFCENALAAEASTFGLFELDMPIVCHTIGTDFGEDGSNMACLLGPDGYKSSWFKFTYSGPDLVDILFQLDLTSLSGYLSSGNVRYRLYYGSDCNTMVVGSECATDANINNSIACVSSIDGTFYVQVTYPQQSSGVLGFNFTVSENTNPDCNPFNPSNLLSQFGYNMNCTLDSLLFDNFSTAGPNIEYLWDFGDGTFSSEYNPVHAYQNAGIYDVELLVINPFFEDTVASMQTIEFTPFQYPIDLGADQTICLGQTTILGEFIPQATYGWSTGENLSEIEVADAGIYFLDLTLNGCTFSDTVQIETIDLNFDLGDTLQICSYDTLAVGYQESFYGASYLWQDGTANDSISITDEGVYWLELSHLGCAVRDSFYVSELDLAFNLGNDTTLCLGDAYSIYPSVVSDVEFLWNDGSVADSLEVTTEGLYTLEIEKDGCFAEDTIEVSTLDLQVDLGPDTIICIGETIELIPTTNAEVSYIWEDGSTSMSITTNSIGTYYVTVDTAACSAMDSVAVDVLDLSFNLGNDTLICSGEFLPINPLVSPNVGFSWSTGEETPTISVDTSGTYSLTIDSLQCSATSQLDLEVLDISFDLGPDTTICDGSVLNLQPSTAPGLAFLWSDGSTGNALSVDTANTYSLSVSDQGCTESDSIEVEVFFVDPIFTSPLSVCLEDTVVASVSGIDSLNWETGLASLYTIDPVTTGFSPDADQNFTFTAYENGCTETGMVSVEVTQPYIPTLSYDQAYCLNEESITFPDIPLTTGEFVYLDQVVDSIDIWLAGAGMLEVAYFYTDTNSCEWSVELPYEIIDTTTTSFNITDPYCIDAGEINLQQYASNAPGLFSFNYGNATTAISDIFYSDSILNYSGIPTEFQITYAYVDANSCLSTLTDSLVIHPLPVVEFDVPNVCLNDTLEISNTTTVDGSTIEQYNWIFAGNGQSDEVIPDDIVYNTDGIFQISLSATSEIGCQSFSDTTVVIYDLPFLEADPYGPFCHNDGQVDLPEVNVSDGNYLIGTAVLEDFLDTYQPGAGEFEIEYNYTDTNACYNEIYIPFTINDTTEISFENEIPPFCVDQDLLNLTDFVSHPGGSVFTILQSGDSLAWNPVLIAALDGDTTQFINYPIIYVYTNQDGCSSTIQNVLEVHPLPEIDFLVQPACIDAPLDISNTSFVNGSSIADQSWDFEGLGIFSEYIPDNLIYETSGVFSINLEITSEVGCVNSAEGSVEIYALPEIASDDFGSLCLNDGVVAFPSASPTGGSYSYLFQEIDALNTYDYAQGLDSLNYIYTDQNNCSDSVSVFFFISDTTTISFIESFAPMCIDDEALALESFLSHTPGNTYSLYDGSDWTDSDFFDPAEILIFNGDSLSVPILYQFTNESGCTSSIIGGITTHPLPVIDVVVPDLCLNEELLVQNNSFVNGSDIATTTWEIASFDPFEVYDPPALSFDDFESLNYSVEISSEIGCFNSEQGSFSVHPVPSSVLNWSGTCEDDVWEFEIESDVAYGEVLSHEWRLEGQSISSTGSLSYEFNDWGTQEFSVSAVSDNGCQDTTATVVFVHPVPIGGMDIADHCFGDDHNISNTSSIPAGEIENIVWSAADEFNVANQGSFQHLFANSGQQVILQYLLSDVGCTTLHIDTLTVHPLPEMSYALSDSLLCSRSEIRFFNTSEIKSGYALEMTVWDIGNGYSAVGDTIDWTTGNPGPLTIEMTGFSDAGCSSTQIFEESIEILPTPTAGFIVDPSLVMISNPEIHVKSQAIGTNLNWEYYLDDDFLTTDPDFHHLFEEVGEYSLQQFVINEYGCYDQTIRSVVVAGNLVFIPNSFTPNGDGVNDTFKPVVSGSEVEQYEFRIWNRWGNEIFYSNVPGQGWNGSGLDGEYYGGIGVFQYQLIIKAANTDVEEFNGSVNLVR